MLCVIIRDYAYIIYSKSIFQSFLCITSDSISEVHYFITHVTTSLDVKRYLLTLCLQIFERQYCIWHSVKRVSYQGYIANKHIINNLYIYIYLAVLTENKMMIFMPFWFWHYCCVITIFRLYDDDLMKCIIIQIIVFTYILQTHILFMIQ